MSIVWVYAFLADAPRAALSMGLAGEPLQVLSADGIHAVVGMMAAAPHAGEVAMLRHDAVVDGLARSVDAIVPMRFGASAPDETSLLAMLSAQATMIAEALALVAGREQMTLRVYDTPSGYAGSSAENPSARPTPHLSERYLTQRLLARASAQYVPEIASLQGTLAALVQAERVEHHVLPPLLASVYHLVARGDGERYTAAVGSALAPLGSVRVDITGPLPPYAFTPTVLSLRAAGA